MQRKVDKSFNGRVDGIFGPMFSGKTSELIRRLKRHSIANLKCLAIKYEKDIRYSSDNISTHEKMIYVARSASQLMPLLEEAKKYDVIGIDEGQFFPDILSFCNELRNAGKIVIVSALDMDFKREPFLLSALLSGICDEPLKMKAVCVVCKKDAAFSKRLTNEQSLEVIGGAETYAATCLYCHEFANTFELEQIDKSQH